MSIEMLAGTGVKLSFFSIKKIGKFGAVFASIPLPIFAGLYCLFFAYVGRCNRNQVKQYIKIL